MFKELRTSFSLFVFFMFLTGLGYPMLVLGIGQNLFPFQANGSLIKNKNQIIGSQLIGQNFNGDGYFHPRPSAAGNGYDAANSSGTNLATTSVDLLKSVGDRVTDIQKTSKLPVPVDLVTSSASGLDPDISPAAVQIQIARVAAARNIAPATLNDLIAEHTQSRSFGFLGENRVNVLELNRALDHMTTPSTAHE